MTLHVNSWLDKNNTRNYPLADEASLGDGTGGLVDCRVSMPYTESTVELYFSSIQVNPAQATLELVRDGVGVVARLSQPNPKPYRTYTMDAEASGYYVTIVLGEAAQNDTRVVDLTLNRNTGRLLPTLVDFYDGAGSSLSFQANGQSIGRDVELLAGGDVRLEVVRRDLGNGENDVIRVSMREDSKLLSSMVEPCRLPTESGLVPELITAINGVRPNTDGTVYLRVIPHYKLAPEGATNYIQVDGVRYDPTKPRFMLEYQNNNTISLLDEDDYHEYCGGAGRDYTITYKEKTCSSCVNPDPDVPAGGFDSADGVPLLYSGAYIRGNELVISWVAQALGTAAPGTKPLGIKITLYDRNGEVYIPALNNAPNPVSLVSINSINGTGKRLGSDLIYCSPTPNSIPLPPNSEFGVPIITSRYRLNQVIPTAQRFSLEVEYDILALSVNAYGRTLRYASMPFTTCILYAQNPQYDPPTLEEVLPQ